MRRDEYLAVLGAGLAEAAPDFVEEARRELSSHLDELSERHPELGEEELVARLTPPDLLAKALLEEFGGRAGEEAEARPREGERLSDRAAGEGRRTPRGGDESEGSIEQEIEAELSRARREASEGEGSGFGEALRSYAGGRRGRRKELRLSLDPGAADRILVRLSSAEVELEAAEGDRLELEAVLERAEGGRRSEAAGRSEDEELGEIARSLVDVREGRVLVQESRRAGRLESLRLRLPLSLGRVLVSLRSGDLEAELPGRDLGVASASGSVEIRGAKRLRVSTMSGSIEAEDCGQVELKSVSGDIAVEGLEEASSVRTSSGEISVTRAGGGLLVSTSSGDVRVEDCPGPVSITSASGEVSLEPGPGFKGGRVETASGDISVELEDGDLDLVAESVAGGIRAGDEEYSDSRARIARRFGSGRVPLLLKSASGEIGVDW